MLALLALLLAAPPSPQTAVYYNARMAQREGRHVEAVKLWLVRNALAANTDTVSGHDVDQRSVTWAALGRLGYCPDGLPLDDDGVGLWPLALHNWTVRNRRPAPPTPANSPFEAFALGRHQRHVSINDVLDADELAALSLQRTGCYWEWRLLAAVAWPWSSLEDSRIAARTLRRLLRESLRTLRWERVVGRAAIEARLFDLNLRLAGLAARQARRARRKAIRDARARGLGRSEIGEMRREAAKADLDAESRGILERSFTWSTEEWLTLAPERRQYLFNQAMGATDTPRQGQPIALGMVDALIAQRRGGELQTWIAHASPDVAARQAIWGGERGERLLSLDPETGFRERGVIALHRGVALLEAGTLPEALRALAYALRWADTSAASERVRGLARRWLSFVAARFRVNDELLAMLRAVVPRADYTSVLEDQLWQAALTADADSFERCVRHQRGRGALQQRAERLRPLAQGDWGAYATAFGDDLADTPYFALRFLGRLLDRLQAQDLTVRRRHVALLRDLKARLSVAQENDSSQRRADALVDRIRSILAGLETLPADASAADRAHALAPGADVYVGTVRVAPSDALPWPFVAAEPRPPSVFLPLTLRPEEWRQPSGDLVFGWRVHEP